MKLRDPQREQKLVEERRTMTQEGNKKGREEEKKIGEEQLDRGWCTVHISTVFSG